MTGARGGPPGGPTAERAGFSAPTGANVDHLHKLARVTSELGAAEDMEAVARAATTHFAEAVRAAVATLLVLDGDGLTMVAGHRLRSGVEQRWAHVPLEHDNPSSEAVRTGRPVMMADGVEARYPSLLGELPAGRSIVSLPLSHAAPSVGVLGLTFDEGWIPGEAELNLLTTFAEACGQAIRRIRASDEARRRAQQLAFLADASVELASSLDYRATLSRVAELTVPTLADWCAVQVAEHGRLSTVAVAHVDPAKVQWAWEMEQRYPPDPDAPTGAMNVLRTGVSELYPVITDELLVAGARDEEHLRLSRELNLRSALAVPLRARDRALGVITMLRTDEAHPYTEADLRFAEELGRRAAISIDNAQLYSQTLDVAKQLQRAVLPERIELPGWEVAAHYEPGGHAEVGGDFYDAVSLGDGRIAFCIGDVMGHGLVAAAAMAQMRAAIRAYLSVDPEPTMVAAKLDTMFAQLGIDRLVSIVYGLVDSAEHTMTVVNAGHHPPLIIPACGPARFVRSEPQRALGAGGDARSETVVDLAPGDTVLLYTDGLVERRDETLSAGLDRLQASVDVLREGPLTTALDRLVADLGEGQPGDDDITVLALRKA